MQKQKRNRRAVTLYLEDDLHHRLKIDAVTNKEEMFDVVAKALEKLLN